MAFARAALLSLAASLQAQAHWSLVPPRRPAVPVVATTTWPAGDLDRFVLAALEARGLAPSPPADRATWLRRATLDLTGLPPTLAELDSFLADDRPDAKERAVDRLLASPHYGEHHARAWLDLARYADTNGYEKDRERSIWPWRDWVIRALDADLPFDRFTIEQLAGDLLPSPSRDQLVATGFHRNSMVNEEGGIDVEEFRYAAVVDRVNTTATTWLGLTVGCAQCHDHKYDPISQREYFALLALFDNCDEVVLPLPDAATEKARAHAEEALAALRRGLADRFPLPVPRAFTPFVPDDARAEEGAELALEPDGSVAARGPVPERDVYVVEGPVAPGMLLGLRVEALVDAVDPSRGPGRSAHGNFVLSELLVSVAEAAADGGAEAWQELPLDAADADFEQAGYPVAAAIDGDGETGWGIHGTGSDWRRDRAARFVLTTPHVVRGPARLRVVLRQGYGGRHTLARLRLSLARAEGAGVDGDIAARRAAHREESFAAWLASERRFARSWQTVIPAVLTSAGAADFAQLGDGSVRVYGNNPDRDTTTLVFMAEREVAALRIEAMPDEVLPAGGPGRSPFYPEGGFTISDARLRVLSPAAEARALAFASALASYEHREHLAAHAIDDRPDTGWTNQENVGRAQHIVLVLAAPIRLGRGERFELTLAQHSIHNNNLGRFRLALCDRAPQARVCAAPPAAEDLLARGAALSPEDLDALRQAFLATTPALGRVHAEIRARERDLPRPPTTLALREREPARARRTPLRHRGEFTRPREVVAAGVPACLPPLPDGASANRLTFARWLVSGEHPLTARVVVNRAWAAFFGRGLVATVEDFGTRGEAPSHPDLLDWLACELVDGGWSMKRLHRSIVTSATYGQTAAVDAAALAADPDGRWLGRAPRVRLSAEALRDQALAVSGLLAPRRFGPSVFPPQPKGVGDVAYGQNEWEASTGADRYRRGIYTFGKRTAPYALQALFDAPSGEACIARRARTNTPLQALALLNDEVFVEAAAALARRVCAHATGDEQRLRYAFMLCVARAPAAAERDLLFAFLERQRARFARGDLDPRALLSAPKDGGLDAEAATGGPASGSSSTPAEVDREAVDLATWTALARVLLNLDEMVVRG